MTRLARLLSPLFVAGCLAPAPGLELREVTPGSAYIGEDTPIEITGTNFYPAITPSSDPSSDGGFRLALIGPAPATEAHDIVYVGQEDFSKLSATVPRGFPLGVYDLRVEAPSGQVGVRPAAISVVDTRIDAIHLDVHTLLYPALTAARIPVSLLDMNEAPVAEDMLVAVELTDLDGQPVDGEITVEGFDGPPVGSGTTYVVGQLGDDGEAIVAPMLREAGPARIRVRSLTDPDRIAPGVAALTWTSGADLRIRIDLLTDPATIRAGDPFLAELSVVYGPEGDEHLATEVATSVAVTDACNSWGAVVQLAPTARVTVRPTVATPQTRCKVDRLDAFALGIEGSSDPFPVAPGPLAALEATVSQPSYVAGAEASVIVRPVDAYGNTAAWTGHVAVIDDGVGGTGEVDCQPGNPVLCAVQVTRAGEIVQLNVLDEDGVGGTSNVFSVFAGPPRRIFAQIDPPVWTAGADGTIVLTATDAWDNPVSGASLAEDALTITGDDGPIDCERGAPGDGRLTCRAYVAGPETFVVSSSASPAIEEGQVDLDVVNGALAAVDVAVSSSSVTAGESLGLTLRARDAWGNRWSYHPNGHVDVVSSDDAFPDGQATIDLHGDGVASVVPTRSGYTDVVLLRDGREVGRSEPVLVTAAPASRLRVSLLAPWGWVGTPTPLRVEALDPWDNRAELTDDVDVVAESGAAATSLLLENGVGEGTITWQSWQLSDALTAVATTVEGVSGQAGPVAAVRACAPVSSPAVDASFGGSSFARACTDETGHGTVSAQITSLPRSGATTIAYGLSVGDHVTIGAASNPRVSVDAPGVHEARALAVQDDGCASELLTSAWLGPRDGLPIGPLDLELDRDALDDQRHQTAVRIRAATACDGALAVGAPILVRADRGTLTGATPTGAGLRVLTGSDGTATLTLDVASTTDGGGPARVTAWRSDGLAYGVVDLTVAGDHRRPTVRSFSVEGTTDVVGTAIVAFSERLDATTVGPAAVLVFGPQIASYTLRSVDGGRSLAIDFDPPLLPTPDGWQVLVQPSVADVAGNLLAGTWGDAPQAWSGWFGAVSAVEPVAGCAVDNTELRPDGDPGAGVERDAVRLSFSSAGLPVWWALSVAASDGRIVRALQVVPTGTSDGWSWDGRDDTGRVVAAGRYRLSVDTKGSKGNRGGACTREVTVGLVEVDP